MGVVDFPNAPTVGQQFTGTNGASYTWDGAVWASGAMASGYLWSSTGPTLTPTDSTDAVAIPGNANTQLILGPRTIKSRVLSNADLDILFLAINGNRGAGGAWAIDDNTKPMWRLGERCDTDTFTVSRAPVGSGTFADLLTVQSDGKTYCTLADTSVTKAMLAVGAGVQVTSYGGFAASGNSSSTTGSWVGIQNTTTVTYRGGERTIIAHPAGRIQIPTASQTLYFGLFRNGTAGTYLIGIKFEGLQSPSASAGGWVPTPPIIGWDTAVGSMYYTFAILQSQGLLWLGASDNSGYIRVLEIS